MSGLAKLGDIAVGVCMGHVPPRPVQGVIALGDPTVLTNGVPTACVGDPVCFNCGHTGVIALGTVTTFIKGRPVAMIGSPVVGPMLATIVLGSPTVLGN